MRHEGSIHIKSRRHGLLAFLRHARGGSGGKGLYFVLLALEGLPASYVSLKVIDYKNHRRWAEDHLKEEASFTPASSLEGKPDADRRSLPQFTFGRNLAAVSRHQVFGDCQSQPCAA